MPDPRSREFAASVAREVIEIVKRTNGRAFVLFTSYANLREVQARASAEIEYPILVQGTAPRSALLRDFKRHRMPSCWRRQVSGRALTSLAKP